MPDDPRTLDRQPADLTPPLHSDIAAPPAGHRSRMGRRLLGFGALLLLAAGLAIGVQQHYRQHLEVAAAAEEQRDFVPRVRVTAVQASPDINKVVLPATTTALRRPTSLLGQAATSFSAMSTSALASRRATCLR